MHTITKETKAKIRAAIEADPERWQTVGGNANGPRDTVIDGHDLTIGWDPLDKTWAVYVQTDGGFEDVEGI